MEYRIGDISKLFNVSKEMIRYYEKQGVIETKRKFDNNYRTYSIWDIFDFMEMLQYREFDITLKDLTKDKNTNLSSWLRRNLYSYYKKTEADIAHMILSKERARELLDRMECYELNEYNYWVKRIPKQYMFHFVSSKGDIYGEIDTSEEIRRGLFSPQIIQFLDPVIVFGEQDEWWYSLTDYYAENLKLPFIDKAEIRPAEYCLCTIVQMGSIGEFSEQVIEPSLAYIHHRGYIQEGTITGMILSRGVEDEQFKRRMEVRIPIRYNE